MSHGRHFNGIDPGAAWVGPQAGWSGVLGNHQSRVNGVSQVNGDSDMAATFLCMLGEMTAQSSTNGFCQLFCLGESSPSIHHSEAR